MTTIKAARVSGQKPPHEGCQWHISGSQKEVGMLCEAPSYVKLSFIISGMPFIFSLWLLFYYT
jgi:hypothetical protein